MAGVDAKREEQPLPSGVRAHCDIPYGTAPEQTLDVYTPLARTNLPVIIDVHGGALIYGNKSLNRRFCYELALCGYAVVSVNYRLVPDVTADCQVRDVMSAMDWTARNIRAYGGDGSAAYLCGDSAGAFLSLAAAACSARSARRTEGKGITVRGCLFISGLYDLDSSPLMRSLRDFAFFGRERALSRIMSALAEWSPPPCYLVTSRGDFLRRQTLDFSGRLTSAGREYCLNYAGKKAGKRAYSHIYPVKHPEWEEARAIIRQALRYLTEHGKGDGQ